MALRPGMPVEIAYCSEFHWIWCQQFIILHWQSFLLSKWIIFQIKSSSVSILIKRLIMHLEDWKRQGLLRLSCLSVCLYMIVHLSFLGQWHFSFTKRSRHYQFRKKTNNLWTFRLQTLCILLALASKGWKLLDFLLSNQGHKQYFFHKITLKLNRICL